MTQISGAVLSSPQETINAPIVTSSLTDPSWFAVRTRPRHEKKVELVLQEKGIHTFLPLFTANHRWSDRCRAVHLPLFPGYLFTRISKNMEARISVLRTAGVIAFVGMEGTGVPVPDEQIEAVQAILHGGISFRPYPFLHEGQRVRIRGGSLDGLQGNLLSINDDQSLIVSVDIIQRSLAIRVVGYRVEPI